jgi:hypothetical protein
VARPAQDRGVGVLEAATLSVLLALAGTALVGYRFGDSNHGITVPILKRLMDPSLYPGDVMVATAERFPTLFYRALAAVLPGTDWIPFAFFTLYVVSIAATLAGAYRIGRWAGGPAAGVLALLFAFPVRIGLAGEALYRVAFSHSHLASALTIWAVAWFLEGRRMLPILALSLGAYNHLLYSAYMLVPMLLVVLWERREAGTRRTLQLLAAALLPLLPLGLWTISRSAPMTREWLALLRLRSSHHSFPSYFGEDLPDAAALLGLSMLAVSRLQVDKRRLVMFFASGVALQFVLGTLFTEFLPWKAVLQYQPHRSWRFLMLILRGVVSAGIVAGWHSGGIGRAVSLVTATVLAIPGLEPLLPVALALEAGLGRPVPAAWARLAAAGVLVGVGGWGDRPLRYDFPGELLPRLMSTTALGAAAIAVVLAVGRGSRFLRPVLAVAAAALALFWLGPDAYGRARARWESGAWREAQDWVKRHTPKDAVLLTPPREAGFRVFSERTVVGEWKDGTQQYFDDAFVKEWGARMEMLGGDGYPKLSDDQLLSLARVYRASYVVLPARPERPGLVEVFRNRGIAVYEARRKATGEAR